MAGYDRPVVDTFLHTPWLGGDDRADPRDDVDWHGDPRLARVMHRKRNMASSPARRKELVAQENSYQQVGIEHIVGGL